MSTNDDAKNQRTKVGYSPELKRAGFFNFAPLEPPLPEAGKLPVDTDGYPPYPTLPAWPSL